VAHPCIAAASASSSSSFRRQVAVRLVDGKLTRYLDIGPKFLDTEGNLPKDIMRDALHPSAAGYRIWADAMQPLLDEMMK
jgi:lysophospholipase L1-like esterase